MDPSIFREEMDPKTYQALKKGDIASLKMLLQESTRSLNGTTAKKNTALHVAASLNYSWSMLEILDIFHNHLSIQFAVNSRGDTPLHCAARSGQNVMVNFLIGTAIGPSGQLHLHMMQNEHGDTPLHEAARNCHFSIASALMKADARLGEVMNKHGESAVYLAAERGAVEIVRTLLQFPTCAVAGPKGQTALHAAVSQSYEITRLLLEERPALSHKVDATESSPLHYAASIGDHKMIQLMLGYDASAAYLLDKDGLSPIHVAASMGYTDIITELIEHCADAGELTDKRGRNFLHIAIENKRLKVVEYVLENRDLSELLNEPDCDGNTPLHLATVGHNLEAVHLLLTDKRIETRSRNYMGFTPLDLASSCLDSNIRLRMHKIMVQLASAGSQFSPQRMDLMTKKLRRKDTEEIKRYRALANNLSIVAVLVGTVTFAAAFTLPGGYENNGPNSGMAILVKKATFKAFLISDAVAMVSSITVTCLLIYTGSLDHDVRLHSISTAMKFMWVALGGMVVAFSMGTYAVVSSGCKWLAILICFMACSVPIIAWLIACWPAIGSLKLVKVARHQEKKEKGLATLKVVDFEMPLRMIVDFETPHASKCDS